jgi:hypothetical protein
MIERKLSNLGRAEAFGFIVMRKGRLESGVARGRLGVVVVGVEEARVVESVRYLSVAR